MLSRSILSSVLLLWATASHAQLLEKEWQSLGSFPAINTIYFVSTGGPPRLGFIGDTDNVFRTSDGGLTWSNAAVNAGHFVASDFAFKDSATGWFTNFVEGGSPVFKTTDGGKTWNPLSAPMPKPCAIYYNAQKSMLIVSSWEAATSNMPGVVAISTDDGATWSVVLRNEPANGTAFLNADTGALTERGDYSFYTTDGGLTWSQSENQNFTDETWQPLGDTFRDIFWAASEAPNETFDYHISYVFESKDFGHNFFNVATVPRSTGTMREGSCGTLYLQTTAAAADSVQGILQSQDGLNWKPLRDGFGTAGPSAVINDTRFFVQGTYVYAGGRVPGDDSVRLWCYVEDTTKYDGGNFTVPLVSTKHFTIVSSDCTKLDSSLFVSYHNDCIPALLESASVTPGAHFEVGLRDTLPQELSGDYPISIEHVPNGRSFDSALLYLHYFANGKDLFDTVLVSGELVGANIISPFDVRVNNAKNVQVPGGDTVRFSIQLTDSIPASVGLDSVRFAFRFDPNVLTFDSAAGEAPWSIRWIGHGPGADTLSMGHTSNGVLKENSVIAQLFYTANVAPAVSTDFTIADIRLNDVSFDGCAGAASLPEPPEVTVIGCADTLLRGEMAGRAILRFLGMESEGGVTFARIRSSESGTLHIEVFNTLGETIASFETPAVAGQQERIPISGLGNNRCYLRISQGGEEIVRAWMPTE